MRKINSPHSFDAVRVMWRKESMKWQLSRTPAQLPCIIASSIVCPISSRRWQACRIIARRTKSFELRSLQGNPLLRWLSSESSKVEVQTVEHNTSHITWNSRRNSHFRYFRFQCVIRHRRTITFIIDYISFHIFSSAEEIESFRFHVLLPIKVDSIITDFFTAANDRRWRS